LERFVSEYSERAYQFAYGLCGNSEEAKELVQESFFRVFRSWGSYDPSQSLEGWFLSILKNVYTDSVRRYDHRYGLSLDAPLVSDHRGEEGTILAERLADEREEAVLDRLTREGTAHDVRRALAGLRVEYKAVLTLCDCEGLSYEQISEALDLPLGTVRSRINRAREALKAAILETSKEVDAHGM
jgi:RNA polymerase sigma-70 factor (ECF subfamily)